MAMRSIIITSCFKECETTRKTECNCMAICKLFL